MAIGHKFFYFIAHFSGISGKLISFFTHLYPCKSYPSVMLTSFSKEKRSSTSSTKSTRSSSIGGVKFPISDDTKSLLIRKDKSPPVGKAKAPSSNSLYVCTDKVLPSHAAEPPHYGVTKSTPPANSKLCAMKSPPSSAPNVKFLQKHFTAKTDYASLGISPYPAPTPYDP